MIAAPKVCGMDQQHLVMLSAHSFALSAMQQVAVNAGLSFMLTSSCGVHVLMTQVDSAVACLLVGFGFSGGDAVK